MFKNDMLALDLGIIKDFQTLIVYKVIPIKLHDNRKSKSQTGLGFIGENYFNFFLIKIATKF